jgi:small subunit ribosomal protein S16
MAVKLRLQRHGKKGKPFFHIVAADSRSPRDGKFIERIGSYNPNTNPATILLENDKAITWLKNGAQPTDTVRAILSYTGVMYYQHLLKGVSKGAFSQEEADRRFEIWKSEKDGKIQSKRDRLAKEANDDLTKRMKHEREVNETRLRAMTDAAAEASAEAASEPAESPAEETASEASAEPTQE